MLQSLGAITVLVHDIDEALRFYTEQLGLEKRADFTMPDGLRLATVGLPNRAGVEIRLQPAAPAARRQEH